MEELELKNIIAKNIALYRKHANMTQLELADKLNYSDKAVSKWERAESVPDVFVLKQLADLFKISVDDFMREKKESKIYIGISIEKRVIIPLMSILLILLIATLVFGLLEMLSAPVNRPWMAFIIAMPAAAVCAIVFSAVWGKAFLTLIIWVSILIWSLALLLYLIFIDLPNNYLFFVIAVPCQIIAILWYLLGKISKVKKQKLQQLP